MTDPSKILVAGDWHGNANFAVNLISWIPRLLPDHPRILLHLGDFGIWPGDAPYLSALDEALENAEAELWFVDGNHEDHRRLRNMMEQRPIEDRRTKPYKINSRIQWLPRGYRWTWHWRTWVALGGAASVDRPVRTILKDWWPQELIDIQDYRAVVDRGPADVMVTHECPEGVPLRLDSAVPAWWELGPAEEQRRGLRNIGRDVQPNWWLHGHHHLFHATKVDLGWGDVQVIGLNCDGVLNGNSVICDVKKMEFTNPWVQ